MDKFSKIDGPQWRTDFVARFKEAALAVLPSDHPARAAFATLGLWTNRKTIDAAYKALRELPDDLQREVLSGWRLPAGTHCRLDGRYFPTLVISADDTGRSASAFYANAAVDFTGSDVQILIACGTSNYSAIEALTTALALVKDNWNALPGRAEGSAASYQREEVPETEPETASPRKVPDVLKAVDFRDHQVGWLVVADENPDRPIAFVHAGKGNEGFHKATDIANDPQLIYSGQGPNCVDLRPYGWPDSRDPMPAFVYGLRLFRVDYTGDCTNAVELECAPPCRFRAARMMIDYGQRAAAAAKSAEKSGVTAPATSSAVEASGQGQSREVNAA